VPQSPMLEKIEEDINVESILLKVVRQASLIYDVSCDFLVGFSDDKETDPKTRQDRAFATYIYQAQTKFSANRDAKLEGKINALMAVHEARCPESVNRFSGRIFRSSNIDRRRSRWLLLSSLFSS
jgi:hypothetical protein